MENWEQNSINILKHLKFNNSNNNNNKIIPWENIKPIIDYSGILFKKIRIIINENDISKCLDFRITVIIKKNQTTIPIKLAALIQDLFCPNSKGNQIYHDKIIGGWVIPINLELFTNDYQYDCIYIEELDENYFFQIQRTDAKVDANANANAETNKPVFKAIRFIGNQLHFYSTIKDLFTIIWEKECPLESYTYMIYNYKSEQYEKKTILSRDFTRVCINDKVAIIIPICVLSVTTLKYFLANMKYDYETLTSLFLFDANSVLILKFRDKRFEGECDMVFLKKMF